MTKTMDLQQLFDFAAKSAANIFNDTGEVMAMWHAVAGNGENVIIATPWRNDDQKDATIRALRQVFAAKQVKRFAFVCEAWMATADPSQGRTAATYSGVMPSKHPDRREVLMIRAEDRDGSMLAGMYYILRPECGPAKLSPLKMQDYDQTSGRMVGMLS